MKTTHYDLQPGSLVRALLNLGNRVHVPVYAITFVFLNKYYSCIFVVEEITVRDRTLADVDLLFARPRCVASCLRLIASLYWLHSPPHTPHSW